MASDPLLDFSPGVGQRASTYLFEVLDPTLEVSGEVHPVAAPTIRNDTNARVMRTMSGVRLSASDARALNPLRDLIRPRFVLEDGRSWAMGAFVFATDDRDLRPGWPALLTLHDQHDYLALNPFTSAFSLERGSLIVPRLIELLQEAGITRINSISPEFAPDDESPGATAARVGQDVLYFAGDDRAAAARRLALMAGLLPPWFDRDGTCQLVPPPPLTQDSETLAASTSDPLVSKVTEGTRRSNLLDAPNTFVVANSGSTEDAIVGIAYIDPALPHSRENRGGREVVHFERVQGLETAADANRMARTMAIVHPTDYAEVDYSGPPDPRHDTFDVVAFDDVPYREVSWELPLTPGGPMRHRLTQTGPELDE